MKQKFFKDISYDVLVAMIQDDVLLIAWQNNNLVLEMITAYDVRDVDNSVFKKRKRFSKININARIILFIFKENEKDVSEKVLKVFKLFFYYNKYIKRVDRFNALTVTYIN